MMNRREFTVSAAAAIAGGALTATPLGMPLGCQTYPVRQSVGKDFEGTLRELAAIGFKHIEMCSPPTYKDGFGPLVNLTAGEMRKKIHDAGLNCESCHYGFRELKEHLDERIAFARELGLKQMILASFGLSKDATLADWRAAAGDLNRVGEKTKKAGIQTGFHNHDGEFKELEGALIYDELMKALDPDLVKMQFQVSVVSLGYQAADFMNKYPGRFISLHLQDWSPEQKKTVAVGSGVVDWKKLFAAARKGGVKNYFVELGLEDMKKSAEFLKDFRA